MKIRLKDVIIKEDKKSKTLTSENYNYKFDKQTGYFERWGKSFDDDPQEGLPEIADIEITTKCTGPGGIPCPFCYKANTPNGFNMTIETYKKILDKLPPSITQIAFGADATCEMNPDIFKIMEVTRNKGIIPNITVADINDEVADKLTEYCGAVAVSRYVNKNFCYDSVKRLTDRGMTQINIHQLICKETFEQTLETINDIHNDPRLSKLNAIVFLSLKTKGRAKKGFTPITQEMFSELTHLCLDSNTRFGFDSCGAHKFLNSIEGFEPQIKKALQESAEPCESSIFSIYIDTHGKFFPCSFSPETDVWSTDGLDVVNCEDFIEDIWYNEQTEQFRKTLLCNNRNCPIYKI